MNDIIEIYLKNAINYDEVINNCFFSIKNQKERKDITIVIPIMGRSDQITTLVNHLVSAIKFYRHKKYRIIFVEQDESPNNKELILSKSCDYVFIRKNKEDRFNKCLCMNVGYLLVKSKYFLFHDVDMVFNKKFFKNIYKNLNRTCKVIHCMSNKSFIFVDENKSEEIKAKKFDINQLVDGYTFTNENLEGFRLSPSYSPGGSMLIDSDLFKYVGGYDDSFFSGYSVEDSFFWDKVELFEKINGCNSPKVLLFHLHHPPNYNSLLSDEVKIHREFIKLNNDIKLNYITLKSKNFKYKKNKYGLFKNS